MTRFRAIGVIWVVVVVGILAPSLIGATVFLGADTLERFAPWDSTPPDDVHVANPLTGDTVDSLTPSRALFKDRLFDGDLAPLWDGYAMGGQQLGSMPNQGLYSPMNTPFWVLPIWYAPVVLKVLELLAATGFMFLFLRRLGLARSSAFIAGMIYAFSGFQVVWTNWPQAHVGALIPGVFWGIEYLLQKRTVISAIPLALVTAVMWLEGFPSVTAYALLFGGVYAIVRVLTSPDWSERGRGLALSLGGVVGGVALAAFQLVPFVFWMNSLDTTSRIQNPNWHLARRTLATLAVPNAFGSPVDAYYGPADYLIYGPVNYVEIQVFIGIAALALIALAAVYGTRIVRRSIALYLWGAVAVAVALMYASSPLLRAFQSLPLIGTNHIGRMRSVLLFLLAVLAGIGFEALVRRMPSRATTRNIIGLIAALGVQAAIIVWSLSRAAEMAADADRTAYLREQVAVAAVVAIVVVAAVAVAHTRSRRWSTAVTYVLPIIVAAEILAFAQPYWPQVPKEQFYPTTDTHEFLAANLGDERIAAAEVALYPSTTTMYGIRSVTAHAFPPPEWADLLRAVDPGAFRYSATFTTLEATPEIATSPILDRMSAEYFVAPPGAPLFGTLIEAPSNAPPTLSPGEAFDLDIGGLLVRGVSLELPAGHEPGPVPDTVITEILDEAGAVVTSGFRRITRRIGPGGFQIAVPETKTGHTLRVRNDGDTPIVFGERPPALVVPSDDLAVGFVGGTVMYERTAALPRIRWASESMIIENGDERVAVLAAGLDHDTVVLSESGSIGGGGAGTITVVEDDAGDRIEVQVTADGPGHLVIADSLQIGWRATLDGEPVPMIDADHIGVAVPISIGEHTVVFDVQPSGWRLGLVVSAISITGLVVAGVAALAERRKRLRTDK